MASSSRGVAAGEGLARPCPREALLSHGEARGGATPLLPLATAPTTAAAPPAQPDLEAGTEAETAFLPLDGLEGAASHDNSRDGRGRPALEVSRGAAAANLQSALEVTLERWGRLCLCMVVLLVLGMFCVLIWSQWIYDAHHNDACDQPLAGMLRLLYVLIAVQAFQREIIRHLLCYNTARDGPDEPCRVLLFRRGSICVALVWPLIGCWMLTESRKCSSELKLAVRVIVSYYAVVVVMVLIVPALFATVMMFMIRRGWIRPPRSRHAAPDDLIDQLPTVTYDPELFNDAAAETQPTLARAPFSATCSICLDAFGPDLPITRTPCLTAGGSTGGDTCLQPELRGHAFHTECLRGWLQTARSCPLCRTDLVDLLEGRTSEGGRDAEAGAALVR